jgi:hypothetical protein
MPVERAQVDRTELTAGWAGTARGACDPSSSSACLRSGKPTPATCFLHASRNFRSLCGCQILVRGQLLLHLAAFWRVESLLDFFAWSERCARLVWCARASTQVRRGGKQDANERSSHGDANLAVLRHREAWLKYYGRLLSRIAVLVLPHHGAAHNFDHEIVDNIPRLAAGVAAHGRNPYSHPDPSVRKAVNRHQPVRFFRVNTRPTFRFAIDVRASGKETP